MNTSASIDQDENARRSGGGLPAPSGGNTAAETVERQAAVQRGETRAQRAAEGNPEPRDPFHGAAPAPIAHHAFAALAENVRDYAIFLVDPDGIITFWGEGARLIKWWTKEEAEGGHLRLLYPDGGSDDGTAEEHLKSAAEDGEYTGEGGRIRSDGSTFWAGVTLTALRDPSGTLLGFAKVTRDLTARRAAEAARKAALDAAEEASRLKGLFLATMSHEIRTPLNSIMAYADLLDMQLGGPLSETQRGQVQKIRTSSQHLLGVVEDVLDLSRIEAGRMVVARDQIRIGTVISQAIVLVDQQAAKRQVDLVNAVSGFAADHLLWGDEERVRQILLNLLGNAVKFTDPGGRITVSAGTVLRPPPDVELVGDGPWVYVRVEDTGRGIPNERLESIFEPFVQADMSLTRQHGGTGLGLSISRRLARLLGGDLKVRSEVDTGSTFFLWLPGAPEDGAQSVGGGSERSPQTSGTLRDLRDAVLAEMERILHAYVARLRSDPATPSARALAESELEDHLASFLSDIAQTLAAMDLPSGAESDMLRDGTAIQRTIAERHGKQRARYGWGEGEVAREFEILREELAAAVRRRLKLPRDAEIGETIGVLGEAVELAERISLKSYREGGDL